MNQIEKARIEEKNPLTKNERNNLFIGLASLVLTCISLKNFTLAENIQQLLLPIIATIGFGIVTLIFFKKSIFARDAKIKKEIVIATLNEIFYTELHYSDELWATTQDPRKHIYWDDMLHEVRRYNLVATSDHKIKSIMVITTNGTPVTYGYRIIYGFEDQQKIVDTHSYNSMCAHELILF